jgi:hypothetical protein
VRGSSRPPRKQGFSLHSPESSSQFVLREHCDRYCATAARCPRLKPHSGRPISKKMCTASLTSNMLVRESRCHPTRPGLGRLRPSQEYAEYGTRNTLSQIRCYTLQRFKITICFRLTCPGQVLVHLSAPLNIFFLIPSTDPLSSSLVHVNHPQSRW